MCTLMTARAHQSSMCVCFDHQSTCAGRPGCLAAERQSVTELPLRRVDALAAASSQHVRPTAVEVLWDPDRHLFQPSALAGSVSLSSPSQAAVHYSAHFFEVSSLPVSCAPSANRSWRPQCLATSNSAEETLG